MLLLSWDTCGHLNPIQIKREHVIQIDHCQDKLTKEFVSSTYEIVLKGLANIGKVSI